MKHTIWLKPIVRFFYLLVLGSCVSRFDPPNISTTGLLVVDGHLFIESNSCKVKLTRSQSLGDDSSPAVEFNAKVSIEDESGNVFQVPERDSSYYSISGLNLSYNTNYRIRIKTQDSKEYLSDFVATNKTPPIDSITFAKGNGSRLVKVNSHDPNNSTWYYRWEFDETWEYTSAVECFYTDSIIKDASGNITTIPVPRKDDIYRCYKSDFGKTILVNSTKKLSQDIVSEFVINAVPTVSAERRLDRKYSVLVRQYALSESEYDYWLELQKSTETTGGLLDPQPTQVTGNIKASNNSDPALGYFSVYSISELRATRTSKQLFKDWNNLIDTCVLVDVPLVGFKLPNYQVILAINIDLMTSKIIGYKLANKDCADCRSKFNGGGTNVVPEFMR